MTANIDHLPIACVASLSLAGRAVTSPETPMREIPKAACSGVGWGDGVFVAVGWKLMTFEDGIKWVERSKRGLHDCVAFANGTFKFNSGFAAP